MPENLNIEHFIWLNKYMLWSVGLWPMDSNASIFRRFFANIRVILLVVALPFHVIAQLGRLIFFWGDLVVISGELRAYSY